MLNESLFCIHIYGKFILYTFFLIKTKLNGSLNLSELFFIIRLSIPGMFEFKKLIKNFNLNTVIFLN